MVKPDDKHLLLARNVRKYLEQLPEKPPANCIPIIDEILSYMAKYAILWMSDTIKAPMIATMPEEAVIGHATEQLDKAPWLSRYSHGVACECKLRASTSFLVKHGVLVGAVREDVFKDSSLPIETLQIPVITLEKPEALAAKLAPHVTPTEKVNPAEFRDDYKKMFDSAMDEYANRRNMLKDLGFGAPQVGPDNMRKVLTEILPGSVVRISVYSGRTIFANGDWLSQLKREDDDVEYRILALGMNVHTTLREGATKASYRKNVLSGILFLRDARHLLPKAARKKIHVRLYGLSMKDALFRGYIVDNPPETAEDQGVWDKIKGVLAPSSIRCCQVTCWQLDYDRGVYGEIAELNGATNLAKMNRKYYDEVYARAVPMNALGMLAYPFRQLTFEQVVQMLSAAAVLWVMRSKPDAPDIEKQIAVGVAILLALKPLLNVGLNIIRLRPFDRYEYLKYLPLWLLRKIVKGEVGLFNRLFPDAVNKGYRAPALPPEPSELACALLPNPPGSEEPVRLPQGGDETENS